MCNYIIGGGCTANILRFFYPDALIIAEEESYKNIPIHYLWDTQYTRKFCEDNKIDFEEEEITNNYVGSGDIEKNIEMYNRMTFKDKNNKPSLGHQKIKILKMSLPDMPEFLPLKVSKIDNDYLTCNCGLKLKYDKVLYCGWLDGLVFNGKEMKQELIDLGILQYIGAPIFKSDYIYCFDEKYLKHGLYRVSRKLDIHSFEMIADENPQSVMELIKTEFPELSFAGAFMVPNAIIKSSDKPEDTENVKFYGRYAQGNYEILQSDVIKKAYNDLGVFL